jgi:8-oxo-dGTP diphosphatase
MATALPDYYMITGKFDDQHDFAHRLEIALQQGDKIVQLRCKTIDDPGEYLELAKIAETLCKRFGAILLLATSVDVFNQTDADGLHLTSQTLHQYDRRPIPAGKLLSVSCHSEDDMLLAEKLGADMLLLSPVKATSSHPGVPGIGWDRFRAMISQVHKPVYALGGMQASDLEDAKSAGAQGVAAISSFWK